MNIVYGILLFSLLIFVHELGHFITAKLSGIQVNEFAMFMGPAICKWQRGETQYSIRCIPFGGYCAMEGEDGESDNPRSFGRAAWWKRLLVLVAGSGMNLIVGLLLFGLAFAPAVAYGDAVITAAEPGCTVVGETGLQVGDRIVAVDGERVYVSSDFSLILMVNPGQIHDITVQRDGQEVLLDDLVMEQHLFDNGDGTQTMRYGFRFGVVEKDFGSWLSYTLRSTVSSVRNVRLSLQMLFTGSAGIQDISGPVGIVQQMGQVVEESPNAVAAFSNIMFFGGFLGVNLCVMNLLPIPALDGGRVFSLVLTVLIEKITRKKLNPKYEAYLHGAGMILLLALMAVILFKDVFTIFKG